MKRSKKFISLFLVFSLLTINCAVVDILTIPIEIPLGKTNKKGRQGAELIVTKLNGQQIMGELITVKPKSLLLLDTKGKDTSVDVVNIRIITIMKKSKAGKGALYGLGFGVVAGGIYKLGREGIIDQGPSTSGIDGIILFGLPAVLIFAIIGAVAGTDETIQIEGMTDSEIQETLDKLSKKARVPNYK